jgi:hypothetical protein
MMLCDLTVGGLLHFGKGAHLCCGKTIAQGIPHTAKAFRNLTMPPERTTSFYRMVGRISFRQTQNKFKWLSLNGIIDTIIFFRFITPIYLFSMGCTTNMLKKCKKILPTGQLHTPLGLLHDSELHSDTAQAHCKKQNG